MLPKRLIAFFVFAAVAFSIASSAHAQWYLMGSPRSAALTMSGNNFIAGTYSGILLSKDTCKTWSCVTSPGIHVIAFLSNDSQLYAGTSKGIFLSTDHGEHWMLKSDTVVGSVWSVAAIGSILFAGTGFPFETVGRGVYRSTNGGQSWVAVNNGLPRSSVSGLAAVGSKLFAAEPQGLFVTTDSGASWTLKDSQLGSPFAVDGDTIFAASHGYTIHYEWYGLSRSTDQGETWVVVDSFMSPQAIAILGTKLFAANRSDLHLEVSHDHGLHWSVPGELSSCLYVGGLGVFAAGEFSGPISRSTDSGTTWSLISAPIGFASKTPFIATAKSLLMGGYHIWRSLDSGETWSRTDSGTLLSAVVALTRIGNCIFAGTGTSTDAGVYVSSDEGATWNAANDGLSCNVVQSLATVGSYLFAGAIKDTGVSNPDPRRPPKVWLLGSGIFRSTDNGGSWSEVKDFLGAGDSVWQINLFASETNLFANGLRSTDSGVTWLDNPNNPYPIAVSGNNLFGISNQRVYLSTDEGNVWTPVSSGLPSNSQIVWAASGSSIFAGTYDSGIFILSATSNSWWPINTGLADTQINNLFVADGYLYANGAMGFWRRPLFEMIGPASVAQPPAPTHELRTYPNPFSQSTTISFTPESSGYAGVSIVNLLGVEVARLFAGELTAGEHSFTWNAATGGSAAADATGMYQCIVRMNGRVESLKLMIVGD